MSVSKKKGAEKMSEERRKKLDEIFRSVEPETKQLVDPLLDEVVFLEQRMSELKALPFVVYDKKNPAFQKNTPAAKMCKECSQSYMNAIRILAGILKRSEPTAADDLMKKLEEFAL